MSKYRSVSQHNTYERCPYRYKLERVDKVWQRPAAWLSQGLGVHKAMEEWELSDRKLSLEECVEIYEKEYISSITELAKYTPNFEFWFASGPYRGPKDIERRFDVGKEQLERLIYYCESHPDDKIWVTPDGKKAIELEFLVEIGGVKVKGFIDQVVETPKGLMVRDIKTGSTPGDAFQLTTYAEALRILYGVEVEFGDYFMGKTGKPTKPTRITQDDRQAVHEMFKALDDNILAEHFPPKPSKENCVMCAVKTSCEFNVF